ncbi:condensation domain-containing protein, partial [Goodfellowiella coeruleoviolacea]
MSRSQRTIEDILPLSPLQEGLVFHSVQAGDGPDIYQVQLVFDLAGPLDAAALRTAMGALLTRHANLRVGFRQRRSGEWVQVVVRDVAPAWREHDLTGLPDPAAEADRLRAADRAERFDLTRPPLVRCTVLRLAAERHRVLTTLHHALFDGWSLPILLRELLALYRSGGDQTVLPPVRPYRDYLDWLATRDRDAAVAAWRDALADLPGATRVSPAASTPQLPASLHFALSTEESTALAELARAHGLTLNTVVQGAWAMVLRSLTGTDDVVFGVTVSGRPAELPGVENMLGLFINTLPLRAGMRPGEPVLAMLARLQDEQARLLPHQHLGLAEIQRAAGVTDLFDTKMVFENYPVNTDELNDSVRTGGLRVLSSDSGDATHYALALLAMPGSALSFRLDRQPEVFDEAFAESVRDRLLRVLRAVLADPEVPVGAVELLSDVERSWLVDSWNATARPVVGGSVVG